MMNYGASNYQTMNFPYAKQSKFKLIQIFATEHQNNKNFGKIFIKIPSDTHVSILVIIMPNSV